MKNSRILLVLLFIGLSFQIVKSQQTLSANELEKLLDRAEIQSQNYRKIFQNLSAEELKTKIYYKANGELDEKRVIKSILVVYQSPNTKSVQEFRNVIEFNGKSVTRDEKEITKFFEKLARADTLQEEYDKLRKESLRFDGKYLEWGMSLEQERPFKENIRDSFKFDVIGKEEINGRSVWIISYKQIKTSPYILANPTAEESKINGGRQYSMATLSEAFRPTNPLISGKIWLDAESAQIWRNQFKVNLNPKTLSKPVGANELFYEYQPSEFGVLLPKNFIIKTYRISGKNEQNLTVKRDAEVIYEYSKFSEFKSDGKETLNLS